MLETESMLKYPATKGAGAAVEQGGSKNLKAMEICKKQKIVTNMLVSVQQQRWSQK